MQLRWVWRLISAGEWLQPLGDGKPLEAWPKAPLVRLGSGLPLTAIRAVHVLAGIIAAVLTHFARSCGTGDRGIGSQSGILAVILSSFRFIVRRFRAVVDILMCTAGLWAPLSESVPSESRTWRHAVELAIGLLLAALVESSWSVCYFSFQYCAGVGVDARRRMLESVARTRRSRYCAAYAPVVLLGVVVTFTAIVLTRGGQIAWIRPAGSYRLKYGTADAISRP